MKILALELSSARGSVGWKGSAGTPFETEFANDRKHSGAFFEALRLCIERFGRPERIVVGLGPGSYAGTRIAIAAAIGLSTAGGAELIGISSVRAMVTAAHDYIVVGDARRRSFYVARVRERRCIEGPLLCAEEELEKRLHQIDVPVLSTAALPQFPSVITAYPSALILAELAAAEPAQPSTLPLEPIYLRDPHITVPKQRLVKAAL